jgi:hypothetical protein
MFREVSGGDKPNFALIVDATGGLPLTEILNATLTPTPAGACRFYVIQNIENSSDSADKVQHIKSSGGINQASLIYLRDNENTVVYPLWSVPTTPDAKIDQKSNIFASMKISLTRMTDGTVEADILAGRDTFHIGDVANASNVKNATLKAVAVMIEKGIVPEVFVYTLIKRMGDWCQALSLLDMDRIYSMFDQSGNFGGTTTLRERLVDTEIGVVTNDRILLAFCLLHGLNVFFTSAMDLARLIYFKNNNDVPDGPALQERANAIFAQFQSGYSGIKPTVDQLAMSLVAALETVRSSIVASTTLPEYIGLLKNFTMNVSKLDAASLSPFDARPEKAEIDKVASEFLRSGDATAAFSVANRLSAQLAKLENSVTIANDRMTALNNNSYPGQLTVRIRLQALAAKLTMGRAPTSATMVEARDILLGIREDIELIRSKGTVSDDILRQLLTPTFAIPDGRQGDNHRAVLSGLDPIRLIIPSAPSGGGGQRGGATVDAVYNALRTRMIRLLPNDIPEVTSTTNTYKRGDEYIGEDMRAYTVVDEYIITKEDLPTFQESDGGDPADRRTKYIDDRLNLLQFDMLRQRYANFLDSFAESLAPYVDPRGTVDPERTNETDIMEPGSQLYETMVSIWNEFRGIFEELIVSLRRPGFPDPAMPPELCPAQADVEIQFSRCRELFISIFSTQGAISQDAIKAQQIATRINEYDDYYKQLAFNAVLPSLPGRLVTVNPDRTQTPTPLGQNLLDVIQNAFLDQNDSDTFTEVRSKVDAQILRVATAVGNFVAVHRPTQDGGPAREAATRVGSLLTGGYKMQLIAETETGVAAEAADAAAIEAEAARIDAARAAAAAAAEAAAAEERRRQEATMNGGRRKTHRRRGLPKLI